MSKKTTYFKLSDKASLFYCPVSRLKVTKTSPGKVEGKPTKKIQNAMNSGHLVKIKEDEFDDLVNDYEGAIKKALVIDAKRKADKIARQKGKIVEEDDEDEETKPLGKQNKDELIETLKELEDITDDKVEEESEGTKKEIKKFIEGYDPETDSGESSDEDDDEDEDGDEE